MAEFDFNVKIAENVMGWIVDRENPPLSPRRRSGGLGLAAGFPFRRCRLPDVSSKDEELGLSAHTRATLWGGRTRNHAAFSPRVF